MKQDKKDSEALKKKLEKWQSRLGANDTAYEHRLALMDKREEIYRGDRAIEALVDGDETAETKHVRNIASEIIESQVNSSIPQPKVTAKYLRYEPLAKMIEDMLRNELDRMPFEEMNDMQERTVPIQGGGGFLLEWDNFLRTHTTVGELVVKTLHPKEIIPQDGVFSGPDDMDYLILKRPQTKRYIQRRYGVDVSDEGEAEPDVKSADDQDTASDMVTQYLGYERNDRGGIDLFSWVGDKTLVDLEDYQARRQRRCGKCGAIEPDETVESVAPTAGGEYPGGADFELNGDGEDMPPKPKAGKAGRKACPYCGGRMFREEAEDFEELYEDITLSRTDLNGNPVVVPKGSKIPYYKPDMYPVVLQKNVSVYGRLLGESDVDKVADQQNTTNRLSQKMIDKVLSAGSYMSRPATASIKKDPGDMKEIVLTKPEEKDMIDVFTLEGDISQDAELREAVYQEARQITGITDSYQGRTDPTATSGVAREFAAAQTAGRLESKRVMKNAAYAKLFEAMFKFKLAYADEPRPVVSRDKHGKAQYSEFNRYDFLERDKAGQWYWNDLFLFSVDTTAPLASNREAMWQETRLNFQTGAFGDPAQLQTLILFWTKMELLHYPGAGDTKEYLEEQLQIEQQMAAMQQQLDEAGKLIEQQNAIIQKIGGQVAGAPGTGTGAGSAPQGGVMPDRAAQIEKQAQADAMRDAQGARPGGQNL